MVGRRSSQRRMSKAHLRRRRPAGQQPAACSRISSDQSVPQRCSSSSGRMLSYAALHVQQRSSTARERKPKQWYAEQPKGTLNMFTHPTMLATMTRAEARCIFPARSKNLRCDLRTSPPRSRYSLGLRTIVRQAVNGWARLPVLQCINKRHGKQQLQPC